MDIIKKGFNFKVRCQFVDAKLKQKIRLLRNEIKQNINAPIPSVASADENETIMNIVDKPPIQSDLSSIPSDVPAIQSDLLYLDNINDSDDDENVTVEITTSNQLNQLNVIKETNVDGNVKTIAYENELIYRHKNIIYLDADNAIAGITRNGKTPMKRYQCRICKKSFTRREYILRHLDGHINKRKKYDCSQCDKNFTYRENLKRHVQTVHNKEKRFLCPETGKRFTTYMQLQTRRCDLCGLNMRAYSLKNHMRKHHGAAITGTKSFKCSKCPKEFFYAQSLRYHMMAHNGERPYKCDICDRTFVQGAHLRTHQITHTGESKHKCNYCQSSYTSAGSLKVHIRLHTGEKPYVCDICEMSFSDLSVFKKHKWNKHQIPIESVKRRVPQID